MARPPSGNPRNVVVTVRLTKGEEEALRDKYGTPGKGVRALLDKALTPSASRAAGAAGRRGPDVVGAYVDEAVVMPRQSGKTKRAKEKVAQARAEGLTVAESEDLPPVEELKGIVDAGEKITPLHRHQRGTVLRTDYVQGQAMKVYQCKVEGCQEELR